MLGFLAASWRQPQSRHSESSRLDRLAVDSRFQCQSGNLEIADTFSMALSLAVRLLRGGGVGHGRAHARYRIDRRCISQLTPRSRDHHLFLHAAGSLCKVCAQAWLDRGADTSRGTRCEVGRGGSWGRQVAFHAKGSCGGLVALAAGGM